MRTWQAFFDLRLLTARLARKTGWAIVMVSVRAVTPICPHVSAHYQADNDNTKQEQPPWTMTTLT